MPVRVDYSSVKKTDIYELGRNVIRLGNTVCKIYDYHMREEVNYKRRNNYSLIKEKLGDNYLPDMKEEKINDNLTLLTYSFIEGKHYPKTVGQLAKVCLDLHKFHENGAVHGDIRYINILFGENDYEAYLIDFDFAGTVGTAIYPPNYNKEGIQERADNAGGNSEIKEEHDVSSMKYIVKSMVNFEKGIDIENMELKEVVYHLKSGKAKLKDNVKEILKEKTR